MWCGHQAPWRLARQLGNVLDLSPDRVRVRVPDVGGAFGTKGPFYAEYAVVAQLARLLHRTVVWLQTRREQFQSGAHGRSQLVRVHIGGDSVGRIRYVDADIIGDVGAYPSSGVIVPTLSVLVAQGNYDIDDLHVRVRGGDEQSADGAISRGG